VRVLPKEGGPPKSTTVRIEASLGIWSPQSQEHLRGQRLPVTVLSRKLMVPVRVAHSAVGGRLMDAGLLHRSFLAMTGTSDEAGPRPARGGETFDPVIARVQRQTLPSRCPAGGSTQQDCISGIPILRSRRR
jgi:hypothetical protein